MHLPMELRETLRSDLPQVIERIEDVARKISDPHQIWLEAMQFADYVSQLANHLGEGHGEDCVQEIAMQLDNMAQSFIEMGENALNVLDEAEGEMNGAQ